MGPAVGRPFLLPPPPRVQPRGGESRTKRKATMTTACSGIQRQAALPGMATTETNGKKRGGMQSSIPPTPPTPSFPTLCSTGRE
jgi:hypothetical protein